MSKEERIQGIRELIERGGFVCNADAKFLLSELPQTGPTQVELDVAKAINIHYDAALAAEGSGWEVSMEPESDYFPTLAEAAAKLFEIMDSALSEMADIASKLSMAPSPTSSEPQTVAEPIDWDKIIGDLSLMAALCDQPEIADGIRKVREKLAQRFHSSVLDTKGLTVTPDGKLEGTLYWPDDDRERDCEPENELLENYSDGEIVEFAAAQILPNFFGYWLPKNDGTDDTECFFFNTKAEAESALTSYRERK